VRPYVLAFETQARRGIIFPGASTRYLFWTNREQREKEREREKGKREKKMDILLDVGV